MKKKNSSAIKVNKKDINFYINKTYQIFEKKIKKNIGKKNFSVAISGGGDSMCLAYLAKLYQKKYKNKIYYLIVDHGLRINSFKEANIVKKILKKHNISGNILRWKGVIPTSNIQASARNIRYSLIYQQCKKHNIKNLLTAHHLDDQIETFLMRLIRGSGLTGLSSMSEKSNYKELNIVRPVLSIKKKDLLKITNYIFKKYIKDPSNKNQKYFRTRVRIFIKLMEKEGLSFSKLSQTISNLNDSKESIEFYTKVAKKKYIKYLKKKCFVDRDIFYQEPNEIIFRTVSEIFTFVSNGNYPPRSKKILNLIKAIKSKNFKKSTLGNCLIIKRSDHIVFEPEKLKI